MQGCSVPGCPRAHTARGYCRMHLLRVYRTGEPGQAAPLRQRGRGEEVGEGSREG